MLSVGVTCVQMNKTSEISTNSGQNYFVGIAAILTSAVTSGFAGIYFERALKTGRHTMWMRNLESAFFSIIFGYIACIKDSQKISEHGFFQNYDKFTVSTIMLQAIGGMIIVAVVNYTDNIIKCFANACSIVTSAVASYLILQDFVPTWLFVVGACLVIISVFVYSSKEDRISGILCFAGVSGVELDVKYANLLKEKVSDRYEERRASIKQGGKNVKLASGYKDAYSIA
jgi:UDP-sugar transporter A1/2/3